MAAADTKAEEKTAAKVEEVKLDEKKVEAEAEEPKESKEPEKPKEMEEDAAADKRKKVKGDAVKFSEADSTLNCMLSADGALLSSLGEGGMQYLLASTRATTGLTSGRYMFEIRIAETLSFNESNNSHGKAPMPKQLVRVGFSLAKSSLFLADSTDSVCFDSEGYFCDGKKRQKVGQKFGTSTIAVLLNLDAKSPNANTISVFKGGSRMCQPLPLPEELRGKALFPAVTYRNVTVEANLGPVPRVPLPFKCHMVGGAAQEDVVVETPTKEDKSEVLMPVGLPDGGMFDWMDAFLEKNPKYTELSDRKIIEWAKKSGLRAPQEAGSNDKPSMSFGVPLMDDGSVRRVIASIAPVIKRNYVIGEVASNLQPEERKSILNKFSAPHFKKTAAVLMGEPNNEYKDAVRAILLKEKVQKAEAEKKRKAQEAERKRLLDEKKKHAEEAKRAKMAAQKKKEDGQDTAPDEEKKEEAQPAPEAKEDDEVPVVLTEEEKTIVHRKRRLPDLSEKAFSKTYTIFELPTKEEGFDEIKYLWQDAKKCAEVLASYKHKLKMTRKVDDLKPSAWFKEQLAAWQKSLSAWKKLQTEWNTPALKKKLLAKRKEEADAKAKEEGKEPAEPMNIDINDLDVMAVEDITDVGTGEPLFAKFAYEDWALLSLRFEFVLLLHAFRKDLDDPERPTFLETHLPFYYKLYFGKPFVAANFACKTFSEVAKLVKDTLELEESGMLKGLLPEDSVASPAGIVKLCESHRRDRERRADAGDETAQLKFPRSAPAQPAQRPPAGAVGAKRPWTPSPAAPAGAAWKQARTAYAPHHYQRR